MFESKETNVSIINVDDINVSSPINVITIDANDIIIVWYDTNNIPKNNLTTYIKNITAKYENVFPNNKVVVSPRNTPISIIKHDSWYDAKYCINIISPLKEGHNNNNNNMR